MVWDLSNPKPFCDPVIPIGIFMSHLPQNPIPASCSSSTEDTNNFSSLEYLIPVSLGMKSCHAEGGVASKKNGMQDGNKHKNQVS